MVQMAEEGNLFSDQAGVNHTHKYITRLQNWKLVD